MEYKCSYLCTLSHVPPRVGVGQPVLVTSVGQAQPSVRGLAARESEGRVGQTLHPSRHHHVPVAQTELSRGEADRLEAAGTDLVDGGAGRAAGQTSAQSRLSCRSLTQS